MNQELLGVSKIMTESFEMLLNRDKNLTQLSTKAGDLRKSSRDLKKEATHLKMAMWFRKYMTPIVVCLLIFFLVCVKWFVF